MALSLPAGYSATSAVRVAIAHIMDNRLAPNQKKSTHGNMYKSWFSDYHSSTMDNGKVLPCVKQIKRVLFKYSAKLIDMVLWNSYIYGYSVCFWYDTHPYIYSNGTFAKQKFCLGCVLTYQSFVWMELLPVSENRFRLGYIYLYIQYIYIHIYYICVCVCWKESPQLNVNSKPKNDHCISQS